MTIQSLFHQSIDMYRPIENGIIYAELQEARLKAEISEYVVTEGIEEQLQRLLWSMLESGNNARVLVSGLRGTGKSSLY